MTKEEALRKIKGYLTDIIPQEDYAEVEEIVKALEQEPCEDAVSRKDALGALEYKLELTSDSGFEKYKPEIKQILNTIYDIQKKQIQALPSVTPIRPKGEWMEIIDEETAYVKTWHYECSECGKNNTCFGGNPNFCPHCGADMRGVKDAT